MNKLLSILFLSAFIFVCITLCVKLLIKWRTSKRIQDNLADALDVTFRRAESEVKSIQERDPDKTPTTKEIQDALRKLRDNGHIHM